MPTREVCQAAEDFRVPLLVDISGRANIVEMLAPQFPNVNFIIPHLGSFSDDWKAHQQVVDQLVRFPNVYADTSGVRRFDYIVQAVKRAGARKVLFGSDGPWLHPGVEIEKIRLLELPPQEEALILGGNAIRLIAQARVGGKRQPPIGSRPRPCECGGCCSTRSKVDGFSGLAEHVPAGAAADQRGWPES